MARAKKRSTPTMARRVAVLALMWVVMDTARAEACSCLPVRRDRLLAGLSDVFVGVVKSGPRPARPEEVSRGQAGAAGPSPVAPSPAPSPALSPPANPASPAADSGRPDSYPGRLVAFEVEVEEALKGSGKGTVVVLSPPDPGQCGVSFVPGQRWLILGRRSRDVVRTGLCFNNVTGDGLAAAVADVKRILTSPTPTPRSFRRMAGPGDAERPTATPRPRVRAGTAIPAASPAAGAAPAAPLAPATLATPARIP